MSAPDTTGLGELAGDPASYFREHSRRWKAQDETPELVAPEPEHTSRNPWPAGFAVPGPVASVVKLAESAGWLTEVRYARGSVVCRRKGPEGTMDRVVERRHSVALRAWDPARNLHAVAVWESAVEAEKLSWKAELAKSWKTGEFPVEVGVTALKALMKETA